METNFDDEFQALSRRETAPRNARRIGVQAEGTYITADQAAFTETYWIAWSQPDRKWVLWARRDLVAPVLPIAALAGNPEEEPEPAQLISAAWRALPDDPPFALQGFVPIDQSPTDLGLEEELASLAGELSQSSQSSQSPPIEEQPPLLG